MPTVDKVVTLTRAEWHIVDQYWRKAGVLKGDIEDKMRELRNEVRELLGAS